jgi:hypothetical protein
MPILPGAVVTAPSRRATVGLWLGHHRPSRREPPPARGYRSILPARRSGSTEHSPCSAMLLRLCTLSCLVADDLRRVPRVEAPASRNQPLSRCRKGNLVQSATLVGQADLRLPSPVTTISALGVAETFSWPRTDCEDHSFDDVGSQPRDWGFRAPNYTSHQTA